MKTDVRFWPIGLVAPYVSQCPVSMIAITRAIELDRPPPV